MGYFRFFFHRPDFFRPYKLKKNIFLTKNLLNYYSLKVTNFYGDSVKNQSARTKKLHGGGAPNAKNFNKSYWIPFIICYNLGGSWRSGFPSHAHWQPDCLGITAYLAFGYAFAFGKGSSIIGLEYFGLANLNLSSYSHAFFQVQIGLLIVFITIIKQ